MTTLYIYGVEFSRYDETTFRCIVESEDVEKAISLINAKEEAKDEFMEVMEERYGEKELAVVNFLSTIMRDDECDREQISKFVTTQTLGLLNEEYTFGCAPTKAGAKMAYIDAQDAENGNGGDWED